MKGFSLLKEHPLRKLRTALLTLFPSPTAWSNFLMIWITLGILISSRGNQLLTLISGIGAFYFLNEWSKAVKEKSE